MRPDLSHFREVMKRLQAVKSLDHSISVPAFGSLFDHRADTPMRRFKRWIADAYDVAWAFPCTNGSTQGNMLGLLTICPPNSRIVVDRGSHVSVFAAMIA